MKTLIKHIARGMGFLWSWLWPVKLSVLCRAVMSYGYTGYLQRRFASFGEGSTILYKAINLNGLEYVHVGSHTEIDPNVCLTAWDCYRGTRYTPRIVIGDHCHIGANAHLTSVSGITIGDNLLTGTNVLITDNAHGASELAWLGVHPEERPLCSKGEVVIGNNVWLGNNVCVLPGVTIGDGAIVGANSVVTKNVPDHAVVAGTPARIVKQIK